MFLEVAKKAVKAVSKTKSVFSGLAMAGGCFFLGVWAMSLQVDHGAVRGGEVSPTAAVTRHQGTEHVLSGDAQVFSGVRFRSASEAVLNHNAATGGVQKANYGADLNPEDPTWLKLTSYDDLYSSDPTEEFYFSAPFEIIAVKAKRKDFFYVLGRSDMGETVIQRWKRANVQQPGQGSYVMRRKEIYRGFQLGDGRDIGIDHLNRFLVVAHGNPLALSTVDLPGGQVTPLYDQLLIPELASWKMGLFPVQHASHGIVWTMSLSGDFLVMYDHNDDGQMDSWAVLDSSQYFFDYGVEGQVLDDFTYNQ